MRLSALERLRRYDGIFRPLGFADVVATARMDDGRVSRVAIEGVCYSEYESGPSLFMLADAVAEIVPGVAWVGLQSCRPVGRGGEDVQGVE